MSVASIAEAAGKAVNEAKGFAKSFLKKAPKLPQPQPSPRMEPVPPKIGAPPGTGVANKPEDGEEDPDDTRVLTFKQAADAVDEVLNASLFDNQGKVDPIRDLTKIIDFFSELVGGGESDSDQAKDIKASLKKRLLPQSKGRSSKEKAGFRRIPLR